MRRLLSIGAVALTVLFSMTPGRAWAQPGLSVRGGVSPRPALVWFGSTVETGSVGRFSFRPGLDIGVGQHLALAGNLEVICRFAVPRLPVWTAYLGGGTSAIVSSGGDRMASQAGYVGGGPAILLGLQRRNGLFADVRIGVAGVDRVPVRVSVGYLVKTFIK